MPLQSDIIDLNEEVSELIFEVEESRASLVSRLLTHTAAVRTRFWQLQDRNTTKTRHTPNSFN